MSKSVHGGPVIVIDEETGDVIGELQRYAIARTGRFLLHPPPELDSRLQMSYLSNLGGLYAELGKIGRAMDHEWLELFEPTATAFDFRSFYQEEYDPADFDVRVWMGWLPSPARIYVAAMVVDDDQLEEATAFSRIVSFFVWMRITVGESVKPWVSGH